MNTKTLIIGAVVVAAAIAGAYWAGLNRNLESAGAEVAPNPPRRSLNQRARQRGT
jgi:uncharacterized protein YllA (UPF0747 family)